MAESGSLTVYPQAYDTSDYSFKSISNPTNPVGKGSGNSSNASVSLNTGAGAESYIFWPFDLSVIPEDATIDSVSCKVKAHITAAVSNTIVATRTMRLYSGNTAKGSETTIPAGGSASVVSLTAGTWTRDELKQCRLRLYAKRGTSNTSITYTLRFYGADLTVTYTYQSEKFMLKIGGAWHDVARVFKKANGIWVEQTDLANVVDQTKRLVNGGEIESSFIQFTINGTSYRAEKGMTWGEWCDSDYNTGMYSVMASGSIMNPSLKAVCTSAGDKVVSTTVIVSGHAYIQA